MLDKTIDSALQQLHRQALNGKGGMDHVLALMALRRLEPVAKRPSPVGGGKRNRETRAIVMQALRDGVTDTGAMAAILLRQRPELTLKLAHLRVYMVRYRLALHRASRDFKRRPCLPTDQTVQIARKLSEDHQSHPVR